MADYLAHCRAKGLAPNTVSGAYAFPLNQVFLPWCVKQGITEPEQLTSRALDRLASDLLEKGGARAPLSKATVHSYLRPINTMLAWAREEGEVGTVKAQLPRLPKTLIDVLSRDETDRFDIEHDTRGVAVGPRLSRSRTLSEEAREIQSG